MLFGWYDIYKQRQKLSSTETFVSVTVFMYAFLQKNNNFVNYCYANFPWSVKPVRMPLDNFVNVLRCPIYTNPYFGGIPLKAP